MIRTKKFENLPQITSISPSGKIVVTENGVDKVISFEDFSNLPPANDVWNNASTTFTASEVNVTDIQSAADSKLLDLKINTVSKFKVDKVGKITGNALQIGDATLASPGYVNISNTGVISFSGSGTGIYEQTFILPGGGGYFRRDGASVINNLAGEQGNQYILNQYGLRLGNVAYVGWSSGNAIAYSTDTFLFRDGAANIIAMRNGVNPQTFRLYNTYTSSTNFERLNLRWDTNVLKIGTEKGTGGGTARDLAFETDGTTRMTVTSGGFVGVGTTTVTDKLTVETGYNGTFSIKNNGFTSFSVSNNGGATTSSFTNGIFTFSTGGTRVIGTTFGSISLPSADVIRASAANFNTGATLQLCTNHGSNISGTNSLQFLSNYGGAATTGTGSVNASISNSLDNTVKFSVAESISAQGLSTNLREVARLNSSGNLGLGTSAPLAKLDIAETWNGASIAVTGASGTGSVATITFDTQSTAIPVGSTIVVASINPSGYNGTFVVTASSVTSVSYANVTSTAYVSGGTVQQLFTAIKTNITDTASATTSKLLDLQVGSSSILTVDKAGNITVPNMTAIRPRGIYANSGFLLGAGSSFNEPIFAIQTINSGGVALSAGRYPAGYSYLALNIYSVLGWGNNTNLSLSSPTLDTIILRDDAAILALRNGINPQSFRIYNTYTDATTFERLNIKWDTNVLKIGTEKGTSGGTARAIEFQTDGTTRMTLPSTGGLSLPNGSDISFGGAFNFYGTTSSTTINGPTAFGQVGVSINGSDKWVFKYDGLLCGAGTTSSFPALKRNGSGIQIRLADDSANTTLEAGNIYATGNVGIGTTSSGAPLHLQATAVNGIRENLFKATLSDAGNTSFEIYNGTNQNGRFSPGFSASMFNANDSLLFSAQTTAAYDTGSIPLVYYWCKRTNSETDPNNSTYALITSRPLFAWANNETTYMQMAANGSLGIGMTSPAARLDIADTTLAGSGSLAGSILNLAQTWNTTGAPTAIKLNVTNTASGAGSNLLDLQVGSVSRLSINNLGGITTGYRKLKYIAADSANYFEIEDNIGQTLTLWPNGELRWSNHTIRLSSDTYIVRDAANTLAMRNGVNPQAFRLYNTYTDATTFERLNIKWDTNVLKIGTEKGSVGGTARNLAFETDGTTRMTITSAGNVGIGTTSPTNPLHVYGTTADQGIILDNVSNPRFSILRAGTERLRFNAVGNIGTISAPSGNGLALGGVADASHLVINSSGNIGIGTIAPTEKLDVVGNLKVSGHFSAATKSFLIDHPTKEGKKLQYGVVESNQHSVLVRGKTAENIIELPEEWAGLVHEDSVTVQLTPIGSYQQLFVISQDNQRVVVGGSTGQYNYTIYGERKDVDKLITEI